MTSLRVLRAIFGSAACLSVALTAWTISRAIADLQMQAEQQWRFRCGLLSGIALTCAIVTLLLVALWFLSRRPCRLHNQLSQ